MNYNLEYYVYMNLKKLEYEVKFYGYRDRLGKLTNVVRMVIARSKTLRNLASVFWLNKVNNEIKKLADELRPDLVLSIKGEAVKPETIKWISNELRAKTALWYPDDPRFFDSLVKYIAPCYDYVFTPSEKAIEMYEQIGVKRVYYLPFACEPAVHRKVELSKGERKLYGSDVCFVGAFTPRRARIIKALEKSGLKIKVWGPYWKYFVHNNRINKGVYGKEMVKAFNAAKIALNIHVESDVAYKVNMRTFEVTGSGVFLLTDYAYGMEKVFKIGNELTIYEDERDLSKLTKRYLDLETRREYIAKKGRQRAYKEHTYEQRVNQLLSRVI